MTVTDLVEAPPAPSVRPPALLGLDRVLWLRLELRDASLCGAVVEGVRHRRPVTVRVDARTASDLAASGVPTTTRRVRSAS